MPRLTACSTLAFSLSTLEVALEHISEYGLQHVEIAEMLTHSKHFPIDTIDPLEVRRLLEKYALKPIVANVTLVDVYRGQPGLVHASQGNQSSAETEEIQQAKRNRVYYRLHVEEEAELYRARARTVIDKARIAGIPQLVLNVGLREQADDIDRALRLSASVLDELAEYARQAGISILLEMPHVWQLYHDAERSKQLLSHLTSNNIGVLLDSTHWHVSGYDIDDYVRFLGDRLWHVHLRDAAGKDSPAGKYQLEITPGQGEVDFGLLGETLDAHGYSGTVTLETEYKNYQDPAEVDRENTQAIAHLKRVGWDVDLEQK